MDCLLIDPTVSSIIVVISYQNDSRVFLGNVGAAGIDGINLSHAVNIYCLARHVLYRKRGCIKILGYCIYSWNAICGHILFSL